MAKRRNVPRYFYFYAVVAVISLLITALPPVSLAAPVSNALPVLNFSDLNSGPKSGNTDGAGGLQPSQHGAIVTVWGNYSGASVKVTFTDSQGVSRPAAHLYYEKRADGTLPGGPANLYTYHRMREVAFSIPASAADGAGQLGLSVDGVESANRLPFLVRAGKIYFVRPGGSDSAGTGTWQSPWATMENVALGNGKISRGDIVYNTGVAIPNAVQVGQAAALAGTADFPFSFVVYPNSRVAANGGTSANGYSVFRNYSNRDFFWNFSKFTITTLEKAFSLFQGSRIVGNKITGPNVQGLSYAGWIGGSCTGMDAATCGGQRIYGNEIYNYGKADGTTSSGHHLYYISNRSGAPAEAYEIAWNFHHDNPVWQGIHIYDMSTCGNWTGTMRIHHNVVQNQGGNAININPNCTQLTKYEVNDNIIITDENYASSGQGVPQAAFRVDTKGSEIRIYNNTVYGYGAPMVLMPSSTIDFRNNIIVDTRSISYSDGNAPTSSSNNLFFSTANPSLSLPAWALNATKADPLFVNVKLRDFNLKLNSPAKYKGSDLALPVSDKDFFGQIRNSGAASIGAIEFGGAPKLRGTVTPTTAP